MSKEASELSSETNENAAQPLPNFVRDQSYGNHIRKEEEILFLFSLGDLLSFVKKRLCSSSFNSHNVSASVCIMPEVHQPILYKGVLKPEIKTAMLSGLAGHILFKEVICCRCSIYHNSTVIGDKRRKHFNCCCRPSARDSRGFWEHGNKEKVS